MNKSFSTPDLCDDFENDISIAEPLFKSFGQIAGFCGEISTIKCFEDNSRVRDAVAEPGTGKVLVIDGQGSLRRALLGDMLAAKAVSNGWAGIIINGCLRDVDEINAMPLGVKALVAHPQKTDKKGIGERDIPVTFAGICWQPGYFVYSDNNGIIVSDKNLLACASFDGNPNSSS